MEIEEDFLKNLPELPPKMWNVDHFQNFLDSIELFQLKECFSN